MNAACRDVRLDLTTLTMKSILALTIASFLVFASPTASAQHTAHAVSSASAAAPASKLQADLRTLWRGHVAQTRAYALAKHSGKTAAARKAELGVIANAKQISNAVAGFYGAPAGERMLTLLAGHWGAVKEMTDASAKHDTAANARAMERLVANAREIAEFLSGANPYLPKDAVFGLLASHGAHHSAQIGQIMKGDMNAEKTTWAAMQRHMDTIADALAGALAKQFPEKAV